MGAGASFGENVTDSLQETNTSIVQSAQTTCKSTCSQSITGGTIVINDSHTGDITFDQVCTNSATCIINNQFDQQVENILTAAANQTNSFSTPLLAVKLNIGVNKDDAKQFITNQLTQVMDSSCGAASFQTVTSQQLYLSGSKTGNISFDQTASPNASCVFNNISSVIVYNQAQTQSNQENKENHLFGGLLAIAGIALLVIIGVAIIGGIFKKKKDAQQMGAPGTPGAEGAATSAERGERSSSVERAAAEAL